MPSMAAMYAAQAHQSRVKDRAAQALVARGYAVHGAYRR